MQARAVLFFVAGVALAAAACGGDDAPSPLSSASGGAGTASPLASASSGAGTASPLSSAAGTPLTSVQLTSDAFAAGAAIPAEYTCSGDNVSPRLSWTGVPGAAKALALVMDDTDAGFTHWLVYDMPPSRMELAKGTPADAALADGSKQGKNDFGDTGYGGPCPPGGSPHHYRFRLFALDAPLGLEAGAGGSAVLEAMTGHILAFGELVGTFQR